MIKKKYVISSDFHLSKNYVEKNKDIGLTPITFRNFVIELYNHPLFIENNQNISTNKYYEDDARLYNILSTLGPKNYFYGSKDYRGSRAIIFDALNELRLSIFDNQISNIELPYNNKAESIKSIYKEFYKTDVFDYTNALLEVIKRVESGEYSEILKSLELLVIDEVELIGYENRLFTLLDKIINKNGTELDLEKLKDCFCTSSITPMGSVYNVLKWMDDNAINDSNTVIVALDYDRYAPLFYQLKDEIDIDLTHGLKAINLSFFPDFMSDLYDRSIIYSDNSEFITKIKKWIQAIKSNTKSGLLSVFYSNALSIVIKIEESLNYYNENDVLVDCYRMLVDELIKLTISRDELQSDYGLKLVKLDDVCSLKLKNVAVLGLNYANYPKKNRIDPILKQNERGSINRSADSILNIDKNNTDKRLEYLTSNTQGELLLCYESHDSTTGKLQVPSSFFNEILKSRNIKLKTENIYNLCKVRSSLSDEFTSPRLEEKTESESTNKNVNKFYNNLYSNEITVLDYGIHKEYSTRLSASQLETFYRCPYSFHLKYNLLLKEPNLSTADLSCWLGPMEKGTFLHRMYEELLKPFIHSTQNYKEFLLGLSDERLIEIFEIAMNSEVDRYSKTTFQDYNSEVPDYIRLTEQKELKENLEEFVTKEIERYENYYPVGLEVPFEFELTIDEETVHFEGLIDRVDTDGCGNYIVLDYKTGKNSFKNEKEYLFCVETQNGPRFYFQHAIYKIALRQHSSYKDINSIDAGYYFSSDKGGWAIVTHNGSDSGDKLKTLVKSYLDEAKNNKYYKNSKSCSFCSYRSICCNVQKLRNHIELPQITKLISCAGVVNVQ